QARRIVNGRGLRMTHRRTRFTMLFAAAAVAIGVTASAGSGRNSIGAADLKTWLTYLSSDELQGRAVFTEGLGLAAGYIQGHLESWGLKPAGDHGTFIQTVRVLGVKSTNRSSVTVRIGNESRTFTNGQGVTFPPNVGAK